MKIVRLGRVVLMGLMLSGSSLAYAGDFSSTKAKIETAMSDKTRPEHHVQRDRNRRPAETLEFFGLRDDMKVLELIPGGGWYTRILAPVLKDKGKLHVAYGTNWMGDLLTQPGFEKVSLQAKSSKVYKPEGAMFYKLENEKLKLKKLDMVLTFRNYHNFEEKSRRALNAAVYKSLKVGGVYGVVDHTRRHMEKNYGENRRRFDPVLAIKEIQEAGFELVDFSDLHYRADDELRYEVGRKTITGNTDRWTLKFRKVK